MAIEAILEHFAMHVRSPHATINAGSRPTPRATVITCHSLRVADHSKSLFIFGLGYTGIGLANYFKHNGWTVAGTSRNLDDLDHLDARGFTTFYLDTYEDPLDEEGLMALTHSTHVISTIPPWRVDGLADPVLDTHAEYLSPTANPALTWAGYISSTSVYGDHGGAWVDEDSPLLAVQGKGAVRAGVEREWLDLWERDRSPVHILRCGGIYGPGRSAVEAAREPGAGIPSQRRRERQQFTARCHVLDICRVVEASIRSPRPGAVYNVVDDDPARRREVIRYAAQLLGLGWVGLPPLSGGNQWEDTEERPRLEEKRVSNALIKRELGIELEFPTYREGIAALVAGDIRPFTPFD